MLQSQVVRHFTCYNMPNFFNSVDPEIKISKYCIKNKFDLVFCRESLRAAYNNIINKIPTILDLHGSEIPGLKKLLEVKNSIYFKGFMTLNNILKQKFIKQGFPAEKIIVMENAVDLEKFDKITPDKIKIRKRLNIPLNKKIILYSGVIGDSRDLDTILDTAKLLDKEKFSFYFVGTGIKKSIRKLKKYIINNQINADIIFTGLKPKKIIPYYLKAADILLATFSPTASSRNYMSPVKVIEYMASKTPFIATKIGRNIEICNNNECLFTNPEDPVDLSEKIKLLITNEELKNKLIKNAYEKAKNHTIKKRCKKIINLSFNMKIKI